MSSTGHCYSLTRSTNTVKIHHPIICPSRTKTNQNFPNLPSPIRPPLLFDCHLGDYSTHHQPQHHCFHCLLHHRLPDHVTIDQRPNSPFLLFDHHPQPPQLINSLLLRPRSRTKPSYALLWSPIKLDSMNNKSNNSRSTFD